MDEAEETLNEMKAAVYEAMALMNRSFEQIISAMYKLEPLGIVSADYVHSQEVRTNEIWARINCDILARINTRELEDRNHYKRMRVDLDKRKK